MKAITVYECPHCKQLFRTPNRHDCKKNPDKRNCFSCRHLKGWTKFEKEDTYTCYHPKPICDSPKKIQCMDDWDLEEIKGMDYNMQCKAYEEGAYDWSQEHTDNENPF